MLVVKVFFSFLSLLIIVAQPISAQNNALSDTDLLFVMDTHSTQIIVRFNRETLNQSTFYADPDPNIIGVRPIVWSPNGRYLLIARGIAEPHIAELCNITRNATLIACFEDTPYLASDSNADQSMVFSWSLDSKKVYFVSVKDKVLSLLEAEATTGKTLRTIYTIALTGQKTYNREYLSWTYDLKFIGINMGKPFDLRGQFYPSVYNTELTVQQEVKPLNTNLDSLSSAYICLQISPKGNYLVGLSPSRSTMYVWNKGGVIQKILGDQEGFYGYCPIWDKTEDTFVFWGRTSYEQIGVFRYRLNTQQITPLYITPINGDQRGFSFSGSLVISPDGQFLAGVGGYSMGDSYIGIAYPDGQARQVGKGRSPLWVPPLDE